MEQWEAAERLQKNSAGEYRAFVNGAWIPVERVQKNAAGQMRVMRKAVPQPQYKVTPEWQKQAGISVARAKAKEDHPVLTGLFDFLTGATTVPRNVLNFLSPGKNVVRDPLGVHPFPEPEQPAGRKLGDALLKPELAGHGALRTAGSLADPAAWMIGGGITKALPYTKVTGQGLTKGAQAVAKNVTSGAASGGTIGALSDSGNALEGAGIGAVANVALPPLAGGVVRGLGVIPEKLAPKSRASQLLRQMAGSDVAAVEQLAARSQPGETAQQALRGLHNDVLAAMDDLARRHDAESYFSKLDAKEQRDILTTLRQLAQGATQTEAMAGRAASRKSLHNVTTPMQEIELRAANMANRLLPRLEAEAERLGAVASQKVGDVRRLERAKDVAEEVAQSGKMRIGGQPPPIVGIPRVPGRYSQATDLAQVAETASQKAADESLIYGAASRDAAQRAASLEAHGLKPLDYGRLLGALTQKLSDPRVRQNDINKRVLGAVAKKIKDEVSRRGTLDAEVLYDIRMNAVNDVIEQKLSGADPATKQKVAARLLAEVRPLIDDAIVDAGGTGWRDYLSTFAKGAQELDKRKLLARLLAEFESSPEGFVKLATGNKPDTVRKIMTTEYDIGKALGNDVVPIQNIADVLTRQKEWQNAAGRGTTALEDLFRHALPRRKLPGFLSRPTLVANRAIDELEHRLNRKTMAELYRAMRTGKDFNEVVTKLPAEQRRHIAAALIATRKAQQATAPIISAKENE